MKSWSCSRTISRSWLSWNNCFWRFTFIRRRRNSPFLLYIIIKVNMKRINCFCWVETSSIDKMEELSYIIEFIVYWHWIINNTCSPIFNISILRRITSNIYFLSIWREFITIINFLLMFWPIKRSIHIKIGKFCFCSYTDVNSYCTHLWNCFRMIWNLLGCSTSHHYIIGKVTSKLINK